MSLPISYWDRNPDAWGKVVEMWRGGMSSGQISRELGVTRNTVNSKLNREGLRRFDPVDYQLLREERRKQNEAAKARQIENKGRRFDLLGDTGALPGSSPRPFLQRAAGECVWIVEGVGVDAKCCCLPVAKGNYCLDHHNIAYGKGGQSA